MGSILIKSLDYVWANYLTMKVEYKDRPDLREVHASLGFILLSFAALEILLFTCAYTIESEGFLAVSTAFACVPGPIVALYFAVLCCAVHSGLDKREAWREWGRDCF